MESAVGAISIDGSHPWGISTCSPPCRSCTPVYFTERNPSTLHATYENALLASVSVRSIFRRPAIVRPLDGPTSDGDFVRPLQRCPGSVEDCNSHRFSTASFGRGSHERRKSSAKISSSSDTTKICEGRIPVSSTWRCRRGQRWRAVRNQAPRTEEKA